MMSTTNQKNESQRRAISQASPQVVYPYSIPADEEIDLRDLWNVIWRGKLIIIAITTVFAIGSVFFALSMPNIYESKALLAPSGAAQGGGISRMAGQLGGLASLAGISLGSGGDDKITKAVEVIKSRKFITEFIERHSILPELMAVEEWNSGDNLVFNSEIYNPERDKWVRKVKPPKEAKPSSWEAFKSFTKIMTVSQNIDTGFVTVAIQHKSPYVAQRWVTLLVQDVNAIMRQSDVAEAQRSIEYLQAQLSKVALADMRNIFYQLIEEQTKTIMLAEAREEYVFSTIDPPVVAEERVSPNRALVCVIATVLGGFLAVIYVFLLHLIRTGKEGKEPDTQDEI